MAKRKKKASDAQPSMFGNTHDTVQSAPQENLPAEPKPVREKSKMLLEIEADAERHCVEGKPIPPRFCMEWDPDYVIRFRDGAS